MRERSSATVGVGITTTVPHAPQHQLPAHRMKRRTSNTVKVMSRCAEGLYARAAPVLEVRQVVQDVDRVLSRVTVVVHSPPPAGTVALFGEHVFYSAPTPERFTPRGRAGVPEHFICP